MNEWNTGLVLQSPFLSITGRHSYDYGTSGELSCLAWFQLSVGPDQIHNSNSNLKGYIFLIPAPEVKKSFLGLIN
jgi:hypothetical protein